LKKSIDLRKPEIKFETKLEQAIHMIIDIADAFFRERIAVATDSWLGNYSLFRPLHQKLGQSFHMHFCQETGMRPVKMGVNHVNEEPVMLLLMYKHRIKAFFAFWVRRY
jgi:hypothetical protein